MYGDMSWNISQLGQYIKMKRSIKSQAWGSLQDAVKPDFFLLFFPEAWTETGKGISTDVVCCCVSSVVFLYCFKYDFPDWVPVGWSASACAVKARLSLLESLREAFSLWLRFLWIPMFVLGKVWVHPHNFPILQCQGNKTSRLLLLTWRIVYLQSRLRDWRRSIRDCDLWHSAEFESHHACCDFLLF